MSCGDTPEMLRTGMLSNYLYADDAPAKPLTAMGRIRKFADERTRRLRDAINVVRGEADICRCDQ